MPKAITNQSKGKSAPTSPVDTVRVTVDEIADNTSLALPILGQLIVDLQHNLHHSTAQTKNRGEVAGSTKKPWRQKGTGRARVGTKRTPLWRGGGRVFGPTSLKNYHHKINQKLLLPGLKTVLAAKAAAGEVLVVARLYSSSDVKTKMALQYLRGQLDPRSNLVVITSANPSLRQAVQNLPYITLRTVNNINLLDVVSHRRIILLEDALRALQARLAK